MCVCVWRGGFTLIGNNGQAESHISKRTAKSCTRTAVNGVDFVLPATLAFNGTFAAWRAREALLMAVSTREPSADSMSELIRAEKGKDCSDASKGFRAFSTAMPCCCSRREGARLKRSNVCDGYAKFARFLRLVVGTGVASKGGGGKQRLQTLFSGNAVLMLQAQGHPIKEVSKSAKDKVWTIRTVEA